MNRSTKFLGLIGLLATGLLLAVVARAPHGTSAAQGATIRLLPGSQNVPIGDSLTIDVAVENATNLAAFEFRLKYNPDVLELIGVTQADFLGSTGRNVTCYRPADADPSQALPGNVGLGCVTGNTPGSEPPVNGSGLLAHIKFSAKGPGLAYLTFVKAELSDVMSEDCCSPVSLSEAAVRVIAPDDPTPESLPPTPTPNPAALTPTPISNAPTPSTWLTPEPGQTPMTRSVENARASGTTGNSGRSDPSGSAGGSPRAGEGPSESDPAWWPPLLAGLLAAVGASLLPLALYLRGASLKRRI
jgi:hypothetical protein